MPGGGGGGGTPGGRGGGGGTPLGELIEGGALPLVPPDGFGGGRGTLGSLFSRCASLILLTTRLSFPSLDCSSELEVAFTTGTFFSFIWDSFGGKTLAGLTPSPNLPSECSVSFILIIIKYIVCESCICYYGIQYFI